MKSVIIVGAFLETIELCEEAGYEILGIIDNCIENSFSNYPILGTDNNVDQIAETYRNCGIVISPDSPNLKKKLSRLYEAAGFVFPNIISPFAHISKSAALSDGITIQAGVNISSNTNIGRFVKLNYNVNVMHDVTIEDYSIIAPNAVLLGRSSIGECTYIGANCTLLPDTHIQSNQCIKPCSIIQGNGSI